VAVQDFAEAGAVDRLFAGQARLDILVNNAAWDPGARLLAGHDPAFIDRLLAVNLRAPYRHRRRGGVLLCDFRAVRLDRTQARSAIDNPGKAGGF
jgi:NAD(P)-dependent dehydrogenase (short-subunit alcohol dehydrogenase family)